MSASSSMAAQLVQSVTPTRARGVWVVYDEGEGKEPRYVARKFFAGGTILLDADESVAADQLPRLRELIPAGLLKLDRHYNDPDAVVETWA